MADAVDDNAADPEGAIAPSPTMAIALDAAPIRWRGYRVFEEIASGGMATVQLAAAPQKRDGERHFVAIKKTHTDFGRRPDFWRL